MDICGPIKSLAIAMGFNCVSGEECDVKIIFKAE
jgi:hypothetical protein